MKLSLVNKKQEAEHVTTFVWHPDTPMEFVGGQHISMRLVHDNPDNRGTVRMFSVSSSPTEGGDFTITTREGVSSFKKALFALPIGGEVDARGPAGIFTTGARKTETSLCLAGGIGITPFRSMFVEARDKKTNGEFILLHSGTTRSDLVFFDVTSQLDERLEAIKATFTITGTQLPSGWTGGVGRIDKEKISQCVDDLTRADVFVAGPKGFVDAMSELVISLGALKNQLHTESFPGY